MTPAEWTSVLVALIAAGLLKYAIDGIRWLSARRRARSPEARESLSMTTVDQSLTIVAKARDELEADNALLRAMLAEERAASASRESDLIRRHASDRSEWATEKASMRAEIDNLQDRLRAMLDELEDLKRRHA